MQSRKFNPFSVTSLFHFLTLLYSLTRDVVVNGLYESRLRYNLPEYNRELTTLIEIQQSWVQEENLPKMYFAKSMIIVSKI